MCSSCSTSSPAPTDGSPKPLSVLLSASLQCLRPSGWQAKRKRGAPIVAPRSITAGSRWDPGRQPRLLLLLLSRGLLGRLLGGCCLLSHSSSPPYVGLIRRRAETGAIVLQASRMAHRRWGRYTPRRCWKARRRCTTQTRFPPLSPRGRRPLSLRRSLLALTLEPAWHSPSSSRLVRDRSPAADHQEPVLGVQCPAAGPHLLTNPLAIVLVFAQRQPRSLERYLVSILIDSMGEDSSCVEV
jgi:hypothetical protein